MFDKFAEDVRLEDEQIRQNEEMMREYNNRSFEPACSGSDYFDPYYGYDLREDPFGWN